MFGESETSHSEDCFCRRAGFCDKKRGGQLIAQLRELSAYGCYVGRLNTLPVANTVLLKIFARSECFEAMAKVMYTHRNRGMGLIFQELSLQSGNLLRQWLLTRFRARRTPEKAWLSICG
jgi:hypothetical protein